YYDQGPTVAAGDAIRQTSVKTYYCPSRRSPPVLSITGDTPDTLFAGVRVPPQYYTGSVSDYACCIGNDLDPETSGIAGQGGNGAFSVALIPWVYVRPPRTGGPPAILGPQRSMTRFSSITDGLSNTLFFGDKHVRLGQFGNGNSEGDGSVYNGDIVSFGGRAAGGVAATPWVSGRPSASELSSAAITPASVSSPSATAACGRSRCPSAHPPSTPWRSATTVVSFRISDPRRQSRIDARRSHEPE